MLFFLFLTIPIFINFNFSITTWISISLILAFFSGLLNEIISQLKNIHNKLTKLFE